MRKVIPLSHASQLFPFLAFFEEVGVPVASALERHKLPSDILRRPAEWIGTRAMSRFAGEIASREGIDGLGWRVMPKSTEAMTARLRNELQTCSSLLEGLETIVARADLESTGLRFRLQWTNDSLFLCHRSSIEPESEGATHFTLMRTAILLSVVRSFTAPDWLPSDIAFAVNGGVETIVREALPRTRIWIAHDEGWLRLPRSILARPPHVGLSAPKMSNGAQGEAALDFVGSLAELLRSSLATGGLTIREAADFAGTSARSLQRELARTGTSYRRVVGGVKLDRARELLRQPDRRILEVALETGFEDPAHFTRFFKSSTGVSPRDYRKAQIEGRG
jgi:AraC-like DNA-binding protein